MPQGDDILCQKHLLSHVFFSFFSLLFYYYLDLKHFEIWFLTGRRIWADSSDSGGSSVGGANGYPSKFCCHWREYFLYRHQSLTDTKIIGAVSIFQFLRRSAFSFAMHILITNDDGPPSSHSSPYVHCLVEHLKAAGHQVSVCLPHTQRSWIGKAHIIGQTLKPLYYRPSSALHGEGDQGTTHTRPSASSDIEEWVLIDGTPASCTQIGLTHLFKDKGPIDLVVSGPNYGRNTTAVFALSSGTMGAALEGAACRKKSIALSFAFFTRNHDPVIIEAACKHSVKVIEALYKQWPSDNSVDLYSVNVPLVEGVDTHKTIFTEILQNYWTDGGCFTEVEDDASDGVDAEEQLRQEQEGGAPATTYKHKYYKWAPKFTDVYKSVEDGGPGSDGWVVQEGNTRQVQLPTATKSSTNVSKV